jgi:hypothetical protein
MALNRTIQAASYLDGLQAAWILPPRALIFSRL